MQKEILRWIDVIKFARYGNPEPLQKIVKSEEEWKKLLTPEQYRITREKGTERSYSGAYCRSYEPGKYRFDVGSGFPSFWDQVDDHVKLNPLDTYGRKRIQLLCNSCGQHLGHLFRDKRTPSELRYCINADRIKKEK